MSFFAAQFESDLEVRWCWIVLLLDLEFIVSAGCCADLVYSSLNPLVAVPVPVL